MAQQGFDIPGYVFEAVDRRMVFVFGEAQLPQSYAFFCPCCGSVWATARVEGQPYYSAVTTPCEKHSTHALAIPGSLWLSWDREFTDAMPYEVLKRELELHLNFYEGVSRQ